MTARRRSHCPAYQPSVLKPRGTRDGHDLVPTPCVIHPLHSAQSIKGPQDTDKLEGASSGGSSPREPGLHRFIGRTAGQYIGRLRRVPPGPFQLAGCGEWVGSRGSGTSSVSNPDYRCAARGGPLGSCGRAVMSLRISLSDNAGRSES